VTEGDLIAMLMMTIAVGRQRKMNGDGSEMTTNARGSELTVMRTIEAEGAKKAKRMIDATKNEVGVTIERNWTKGIFSEKRKALWERLRINMRSTMVRQISCKNRGTLVRYKTRN
jgi:hypothetical protein